MAPSFHPRQVNGPFEDPALFISFQHEKRALLFDLGDIDPLSSKDILKISHVFVSHTHMDHFVGFDRLLRVLLGREKTLSLFGPEGFLKNVEGKLASYTWNLVRQYAYPFVLAVSEVLEDRILTRRYSCRSEFQPEDEKTTENIDGVLLKEPSFTVSCAILDHRVPCLSFCLSERFHININKDRAEKMGLAMGPWLKDFKNAIYDGKDLDSRFVAPLAEEGKSGKNFRLEELVEQIALITPGQKISYVTDAAFSEENVEKIVSLCQNSDKLFIEACFLEKDRDVAREKFHLTAAQAGLIARKAQAKEFSIFHFSPRYSGEENLLEKEAEEARATGTVPRTPGTNPSLG